MLFFNIKTIIQNVWPGLFLLLYYNFFPITLIYFRSKCTYFFSNVLNILHNVKILILLHIVLQKIYILFILWWMFLWDSHSYGVWQHFVTVPEWKQEMLSTFESNYLTHFLQTLHFKRYHSVRLITVVSKAKDPNACQFNTKSSN